jgi:hypothetical protein
VEKVKKQKFVSTLSSKSVVHGIDVDVEPVKENFLEEEVARERENLHRLQAKSSPQSQKKAESEKLAVFNGVINLDAPAQPNTGHQRIVRLLELGLKDSLDRFAYPNNPYGLLPTKRKLRSKRKYGTGLIHEADYDI